VPIQLKCPNGHHLTAKESNAGKTGKCPVCKAAVNIPVLRQTLITDSAVVSILGDPSSVKKNRTGTTPSPTVKKTAAPSLKQSGSSGSGSSLSSTSSVLPHVRLCPNCEQEIDMGYHICPHCHTYITGLNDF
jgi:Zn finger protein HypA/HybF involved in hydrogenase expression